MSTALKPGILALVVALAGTCAALAAPTAHTQSSEPSAEPGILRPETAARFSKMVERDLAARRARVAIVFRAGQARETLPDGISYTHAAFWVHQQIAAPDGTRLKGYNTYNLYHGDGEQVARSASYLKEDFPFQFIAPMKETDIAIIIPSQALQSRLLQAIASDTYQAMHVPAYSLVSNVADPDFQNCTEFVLDVVAAAAWQTDDYGQVKANLAAHFEPTPVSVGPLKQVFGPMVDARVTTRDHKGRIETATFESLARFLDENDWADQVYTLDAADTGP
jgi:hypothetical protein